MAEDRKLAGMWCSQVLERLSAFLDGELDPEEREQLEAHLRQCDACTRFGDAFASCLGELRRELSGSQDVNPELAARLNETLRKAQS